MKLFPHVVNYDELLYEGLTWVTQGGRFDGKIDTCEQWTPEYTEDVEVRCKNCHYQLHAHLIGALTKDHRRQARVIEGLMAWATEHARWIDKEDLRKKIAELEMETV